MSAAGALRARAGSSIAREAHLDDRRSFRRRKAPRTRKRRSFEADVSRLLHLMVHSVYSDRDIFVRELVSNAADACEKLRYEAIARPELIDDGGPFAITHRASIRTKRR